MADYSIDDILAEIDAKKAGKSAAESGRSGYDDTGGRRKSAADSILDEIGDSGGKKPDFSATAILEGLNLGQGDKKGNIREESETPRVERERHERNEHRERDRRGDYDDYDERDERDYHEYREGHDEERKKPSEHSKQAEITTHTQKSETPERPKQAERPEQPAEFDTEEKTRRRRKYDEEPKKPRAVKTENTPRSEAKTRKTEPESEDRPNLPDNGDDGYIMSDDSGEIEPYRDYESFNKLKREQTGPLVLTGTKKRRTEQTASLTLGGLLKGKDSRSGRVREDDTPDDETSVSDDSGANNSMALVSLAQSDAVIYARDKTAEEDNAYNDEEEERRRTKEEKEELQRQLILKKERENTNPDDMLDLINPMDIKEKASSEAKSGGQGQAKEATGALPSIGALSGQYRGSTQSINNEQLRDVPILKSELGEKVNDAKDYLHSDIREYTGRRGTDELIERLNKSLEERRREIAKTHRTITLHNIKGKVPTLAHPLNIDYKKQIIEATGTLPEENPVIAQERIREEQAEKKHNIMDFIIDDDGADDEENEEETDDIDEFDDYDSSALIWADLCRSHNGLKIRLTLLTVITLVSVFISMLNDFNLFGAMGASDTLGIINRLGDATSLIYITLVCGILGYAVCGAIISNGFFKLFKGRPDCDSVCALTCALSLIGGVAALIDLQSFKLAHAFIYVPTTLVALIFNNVGKLFMITRAKRNFKFVSGDSTKYYADLVENEASVSVLTRAASDNIPIIAAMRKTEFLSDFLKSSYCDDAADKICSRLVPVSIILGLLTGLLAYLNPFGSEFLIKINNESPLLWAISSAVAVISAAVPFSILLMINHPLNMASKTLSESNAAILGYDAAERFGGVNTVLLDAKTLFPAGSIVMHKVKRCQKKKSVMKISIEDAILMAASVAIHTDGVLSYLFYDVTLGNKDLLQKVDNCIYEDNCGVTGWIGAKRVMLGGRALMERHSIDVPSEKNEQKYCGTEYEPVYLAVSGEVVAMFVINMTANNEIKADLQQMQKMGITLLIRTTDSLITREKVSDLFDLDPMFVSVLPHEAHEEYDACTKYTSRGSGEVSCNGTFSSFAKAIMTAKNLSRMFSISKYILISLAALGVFLTLIMVLFRHTALITPTVIIIYNSLSAAAMLIYQKLRKV